MNTIKSHVVVTMRDNQVVGMLAFPFTLDGFDDANKHFDKVVKVCTPLNGYHTSLCTTATPNEVKSEKDNTREVIIHEYIKDKKGNKIGCMVGVGVCGKRFDVGWSLVNRSAGDVFDKDTAFQIAYNRAMMDGVECGPIPQSLLKFYDYFFARCERYFKMNGTPEKKISSELKFEKALLDEYEIVREEKLGSCSGCVFF